MDRQRLADTLAQGLQPVRRRSLGQDAAVLLALCAVELGLFLGLGMARPDMDMAMRQPSFWWKLASMGVIAAVGGVTALLSFDPVHAPRNGRRAVAGLMVLSLAVGWLIDAAQDGWPSLAARVNWHGGVQCATKMALLSVPAVVALGLLMRRGAAVDAAGSGLLAGAAAAGWGAFVFVFACPVDDPLYIAIWYAAGCGIVTLAARLILPALTRW